MKACLWIYEKASKELFWIMGPFDSFASAKEWVEKHENEESWKDYYFETSNLLSP